jgi:hypothetical protein
LAVSFGRSILERFNVEWERVGVSRDGLDDLAEFMLRILQSLVIDPGRPPREADDLRRFLRRWVAPALSVTTAERRSDFQT